ncbi:MAG: DUF3768 domain-containing protein [Caldilineaceae bacterium]
MSDKAQLIAEQNDQFRTTCGLPIPPQARPVPGQLMITAGIAALPGEVQAEIVRAVMAFNDFTEDNDPYGEHDFGSLVHAAAGKIFWKFDYYDPELRFGSDDPSDLSQTMRVLTIMLAEEY